MAGKRNTLNADALALGEDDGGLVSRWSDKVVHYYANEGPKMRFIIIWCLANTIYFFYTYHTFRTGDSYVRFGEGVTMARGCGAILKLNASFILLPVCRNLMLFLRETFLNNLFLPVDKAIAFHKKIGWTIAVAAYVHTVAHLFNVQTLAKYDRDELGSKGKDGTALVQNIPDGFPKNGRWSEMDWLLRSIPGFTGVAICICMFFMYSTAIRQVRSPYFEAFWYTHHLFILFYFFLILHGLGEMLQPAEFWFFFLIPGTLYAYERFNRWRRADHTTIVVDAIEHPSRVIELRFQKDGFQYKVGQYIFLNCPFISTKEWHPFTISSCPADEYVSVHIRQVGDWTKDFGQLMLKSEYRDTILNTSTLNGMPAIRVDGPFGAAADKCMTDYTVAVLCAAGIGVTPFSAILKEIRVRYLSGVDFPLRRVYFIWTSRDREAFEWFGELLSEFERGDLRGLLSINVYLTGGLKISDIRNIVYDDPDAGDQVTGLQTDTKFGRPNYMAIMEELAEIHAGERIGVFLCGPRALADTIRSACRTYTTPGSTTFVFNKENF